MAQKGSGIYRVKITGKWKLQVVYVDWTEKSCRVATQSAFRFYKA